MSDSDHFRDGRFFNPNGANGQPLRNVPFMLTERGARWPSQVAVDQRRPPRPATSADIVVTFIGHATFLIQTAAVNIITDPVFAQRAGPFGIAGPRRVRQPGVRFDDLPPIDVVLLSHNHYDHCDLKALRAIQAQSAPEEGAHCVRVVTLLGHGPLLKRAGIANADELDWWQATEVPVPASARTQVQITATQAQHFSARTPFDRNRALWGGFVIEVGGPQQAAPRRLYFAGDSGYGAHFKEVGRRFAPIDLALIPIGAYEPRWFMKDIHMNPEEAVQAHIEVGARRSVGMHFGTFQLTTEAIDEPVEALGRARQKARLKDDEFVTIDVGSSIHLPSLAIAP